MNDKCDELLDLRQAAQYAHVTRQAIYIAISTGAMKARKVNNKWMVTTEEIDEYRLNKYNRDLRKQEGEYVFDMDKGHFSIPQVCKIYSASMGRPYPIQRLYYLVRKGDLPSFRKGCAIVIRQEDAISMLEKERESINDPRFLRQFA